jgi:hypothetical protein
MGSWTNPNVQGVTPIVTSGSLAAGSNVQTITPTAGFNAANLVNVAQYASYDLNTYIYANNAGAAGSPITALIQLLWYDDTVSGIPVFEEQWWIWTGRAAAAFSDNMVGSGPMHGQYMTVNISIPNQATSNATLQYFNLFGSPRVVPYSDWRQDAFQIQPETNGLAIISPNTSSYENQLVAVNSFTLTANTSSWVPIGLYAGPAYLRFRISITPQAGVFLASAENVVAGQPITGSGTPNIISGFFGASVGGTDYDGQVILPRAPCYIAMLAATGTGGVLSFSVVGQQAA